MKSLTLRFSDEELKRLRRLKNLGFSSITEVIKCASLSMADSAQRSDGKPTPQPA